MNDDAPSFLFGEDHVRRYRETDGEDGHEWFEGTTILLLTTTGRKSGEPRTTPLIYDRSGDDLLVVASQGGAPKHPAWYLNLQADPEAEVQVKGERYRVRARDANAEERPAMWEQMNRMWQHYDTYQTLTDREIPVVVLERA